MSGDDNDKGMSFGGEPDGDFNFLAAESHKEEEPCNNFRLDVSAGFGMCKCGHPKAAHGKKSDNRAAKMVENLKKQNEAKQSMDENDLDVIVPLDGPCNKFRLDVAAGFGTCKCGYKRAEHVQHEENRAAKMLDNIKKKNEVKYRGSSVASNGASNGACDEYRVDVSAPEFGTCICGFKKDDHKAKEENVAAKMLMNLKEKNKAKHSDEQEKVSNQAAVNTLNAAEANANTATNTPVKPNAGGSCCIIA